MKKIIAFLLVLVLVAGLAGCGETAPKKKKQKVVYIDAPASSQNDDSSDIEDDDSDMSSEDEDWEDYEDWEDVYSESDDTADTSFEEEDYEEEESVEVEKVISIASKVTASSIGSNYYTLKPEFFHPGVVGLDARYKMIAKSKSNNVLSADRMRFKCDEPSVKFEKDTVIVPYSLRQGGKTLKITVYDVNNPTRTGSYTFKFRDFSATPTLEDEFDYFKPELWYYEGGGHYGNHQGEYKDGYMNYTIVEEGKGGWEQTTQGNFSQAFGCFSAKIKLPHQGSCNAAFWLCSDFLDLDNQDAGRIEGLYNPQAPGQSSIEIDVFEYAAGLGAFNTHSYHWHGWSGYHKSQGTESGHLPSMEPLYNDYHVYSVVWTEDTIYWYIDEHLTYYVTGEMVGYGKCLVLLQLVPVFGEGHWITGDFNPEELPYTMSWDWVRVYSLDDLDWDKTNKPKN